MKLEQKLHRFFIFLLHVHNILQAEIQALRNENEMLRNHADPGVQQEIDLQAQLDLRMVSQSIMLTPNYSNN